MIYKFRPGSHCKGDPQVVGEALTAIRDVRGRLTAADVVEEATATDSVLHVQFEWNDAEAAYQFRLEQARNLIRSVVIIETEDHGEITPIRAFAKIHTEDVDSYEPIHRVLSDRNLRDAVLREVRAEIASLREKLKAYQEFADVLGALELVEKTVSTHLEASLG